MKKNIRFLTVSPRFMHWLETHKESRDEEAEALCGALAELYSDEVASVILEKTGESARVSFPEEPDRLTFGELTISVRERKVTLAGRRILLTAKEFDILYFLAKNRGVVFTKEQIYREVWGRDYLLVDSNIMAFIRKLRKKIEPEPDNPVYILTVWGVGYRFSDEF